MNRIFKNIRSIIFLPMTFLNFFILKVNGVKYKKVDANGFLYIFNSGTIEFGDYVKINSSSFKNIIGGDTRSTIVVKKGARLKFGNNVRMSNSAIYCAESIEIGNNVMIGGSVKIWDTDFHSLDTADRVKTPNEGYRTKPVRIEDDVFIGGFSIILKGVNIGYGSIIGAGSVVSKNVPANEIWAGNPATFIRKKAE